MTIHRHLRAAAAAFVFAIAAPVAGHAHDLGLAGLLQGVQTLDPITLSSGKPLTDKPYELKAGQYYRLAIEADGSAELALEGPSFFRNVWINEVVINDIEVRPMGGIDSLEFDDEGTAEISFVTIRPGRFTLQIPGASGDSQIAVFNVK